MADTTATDEILAWSAEREPWMQDALRRIAENGGLDDDICAAVLENIKQANTLSAEEDEDGEGNDDDEGEDIHEDNGLVSLSADHLTDIQGGGFSEVRLEAIKDIRHVGRLADDAELEFETGGLTAIYGDNGAGKSAYGRILKKATHARGIDRKPILPDVFEDDPGQPATAQFKLVGKSDLIPWQDEEDTSPIRGISVFDSHVGSLYIDQGNNIQLLPFNLDLIKHLIDLCDWLRGELRNEKQDLQNTLPELTFPGELTLTTASIFWGVIDANTTEAQITDNCAISEDELSELERLRAPQLRLAAHAPITELYDSLELAEAWFDDEALETIRSYKQSGEADLETANEASEHLTKGHTLPITSPAWAAMFEAAKTYADDVAHAFPPAQGESSHCPLCQQELDADANERLRDFDAYVIDEMRVTAQDKIDSYEDTLQELREVLHALRNAWTDCLGNDNTLAVLGADQDTIQAAVDGLNARAEVLSNWLDNEGDLLGLAEAVSPRLSEIKTALDEDLQAYQEGEDSEEGQKRTQRLLELEHKKILADNIDQARSKANIVKQLAVLDAAHGEANPAPVTTKFNTLKSTYMTAPVMEAYEREFEALNLGRLQIEVGKVNSRDGAKFKLALKDQKVPGSLPDILSEGERRALSLAAFLAEQDIGGSGCLVFDDPMSSLDHNWTTIVAKRLVQEAQNRQIIALTHDLVFFTDIYKHTDDHNRVSIVQGNSKIDVRYEQLIRTPKASLGKMDPAGPPLRAVRIKERLKRLTPLVEAACGITDSQEHYELAAKNCYGRIGDTWERVVEELLFHEVVQRFQRDVKTQELRYLTSCPDTLKDIHDGMTKANTFRHDNPAANSDPIPDADELKQDFEHLKAVIDRLKAHHSSVDKKT